MTLFEIMEAKKGAFSKNERLIYEMVRKNPEIYAYDTLSQAADHSHMNKPSLVRFAQKLGFSGFTQMQYKLQEDLKNLESAPALSHAEQYAAILKNVEESVDPDRLEAFVRKIRSSNAVYILGVHLSSLPANLLNIILMYEEDVVAVNPAIGMIPMSFHENDVVIVYSAISGGTFPSFIRHLKEYDGKKPYMVLVTVNPRHPLRHNFDETFVLPSSSSNADETSIVLSDTFAFMMFDDMVMRKLKQTGK